MLNVCYGKCHNQIYYGECHYVECLGALKARCLCVNSRTVEHSTHNSKREGSLAITVTAKEEIAKKS
jgi:hypothetical protein